MLTFVAALVLTYLQTSVSAQQIYPLRQASLNSRAGTDPGAAPNTFESSEAAAEKQRLRFRFSWGGGNAQTWAGKIIVNNGSFSEIAPLGLTSDAPASVVQVGEEVWIDHWSPTDYGGADISIEGDLETEVQIQLFSRERSESKFEQTVSLRELIAGTVGGEIDLLGNRCSVVRVPGDELKVEFDREHLVFSPRERFQFSVRPNATGLIERTAVCRIKLIAAYPQGRMGNRPTFTDTLSFNLDKNGSAEAQLVELDVPDDEAVYNVEFELTPSRYQASFGSRKDMVERKVQLLVLEKNESDTFPPDLSDQKSWRQIATADPINLEQNSFPSWTQFTRMTGMSNQNTLGNELRSPVSFGRQTMMRLAPGGWQAIPLSTAELHKPHIVELEYVAEDELALGISVLQPDASGQIPTRGFDSGVYIPRTLVSDESSGKQIRHHRVTIWPKTKTPYLLIANRHATAGATIGKVNIFAGPDRMEPSSLHTQQKHANVSTRKLMAFFEAPLFAESFGARVAIDPQMETPLDDWRMFHEGASRFIQYLKANAYHGAYVTVAGDGSAIYPSQLMASSPKYDNGTFFSTGQDPIRKDVLEMLFRMFEREGLVLVPTLAMSGPLKDVEAIRKRDDQSLQPADGIDTPSDFEMIDLNGVAKPTRIEKQLPVYNPLDRTVQHAVRQVVHELAARYQGYTAFDGVAIMCRPDTYTLLPGRQWGYDATTIQRFVQLQPDLESVPQQWAEIQNILLGTHRKQWNQWRAAEMTKWYQDLAAEVKRAVPAGKLYLAPVDLYRNEETASALSPSLHASIDFEQVMLHLGFEPEFVRSTGINSSAENSNIVLLHPHRIAPDQSFSSQRIDKSVEDSKQSRRYFSNVGYAGDLFTHRISWAHFAQLQEQSPFGEQKSALMRLQQMTPAGAGNRKRFVESIRHRDSRLLIDGGWMLTMGQESSVVEMMNVFGRLPDVPFSDVPAMQNGVPEDGTSQQALSIAVRQVQAGGQTYFYAVNVSPWSTNVQIKLNSTSETAVLESLSNQEFDVRRAELTATKHQNDANPSVHNPIVHNPINHNLTANVEVPPYGLIGARVSNDVKVLGFDFDLPENADQSLRRHVYVLQSKLTKSGSPAAMRSIENSNFEFNGQPTMGGWDIGQQPTGKVRLELDQNADAADQRLDGSPAQDLGRASLLMSNDSNTPVWVRSNFFEPTETGRLSISVWLKTNDAAVQPPLRLALEGQSNGSNYYRFGSVGSLSPVPKSNQLDVRWKRFAVHFDDLPVEGLDNVRIGFDLMGPGQVSIDNVEVFDRWFDENDAKAITQLLASSGPLLSNPKTFDSCRRLLEGYWPSFLDQFIELDDVGTDRAGLGTQNKQTQLRPEREAERKTQKFRRFRNLVPQKKSTLR